MSTRVIRRNFMTWREDPDELIDLGESPAHVEVRQQCHEQMLNFVDPEVANDRAFSDQATLIETLGGFDAVLNSDEFDFTPVEG